MWPSASPPSATAGVTHLQVTPIPIGDQTPVDLIAKVKELIGDERQRPTRPPPSLVGDELAPGVLDGVEGEQRVELLCHLLDLVRFVVTAVERQGQLVLHQGKRVLGGGCGVVDREEAGLHGLGGHEAGTATCGLGGKGPQCVAGRGGRRIGGPGRLHCMLLVHGLLPFMVSTPPLWWSTHSTPRERHFVRIPGEVHRSATVGRDSGRGGSAPLRTGAMMSGRGAVPSGTDRTQGGPARMEGPITDSAREAMLLAALDAGWTPAPSANRSRSCRTPVSRSPSPSPTPWRRCANTGTRSRVSGGPYRAALLYAAAVYAEPCLAAVIEALGDAADDPTREQLLEAIDSVGDTYDDVTVTVMLASVADGVMAASDLCFTLLDTRAGSDLDPGGTPSSAPSRRVSRAGPKPGGPPRSSAGPDGPGTTRVGGAPPEGG